MSVYRNEKKSPYWQYAFTLKGTRFYGSTGVKNPGEKGKREALKFEEDALEIAKRQVAKARVETLSLQIGDVAERYMAKVGNHHVNSKDTERDTNRLVEYFGATKLMTKITDVEVSDLIDWRRKDRVVPTAVRKISPPDTDLTTYPLVSNATVNRTTLEGLKRMFVFLRDNERVRFPVWPNWKSHRLDEAEERVRELGDSEREKLMGATRDDYEDFFTFAMKLGARMSECLLRWDQVNLEEGRITRPGKGGKLVSNPITAEMREILEAQKGNHPDFVFTYVALMDRTTPMPRVKGQRYPMTYAGVQSAWKALRKKSGVKDFRFHDIRHDVATKALRRTKNVKLVQQMMGHKNIKTTLKYAHVLDGEVAEALEGLIKIGAKAPKMKVAAKRKDKSA